ncbi:hypothetical protein Tco_1039836 [Tanacetum coccineum]
MDKTEIAGRLLKRLSVSPTGERRIWLEKLEEMDWIERSRWNESYSGIISISSGTAYLFLQYDRLIEGFIFLEKNNSVQINSQEYGRNWGLVRMVCTLGERLEEYVVWKQLIDIPFQRVLHMKTDSVISLQHIVVSTTETPVVANFANFV